MKSESIPMEGKEKPEKEPDYSRLAGRRFNEQRGLT